MRQVSPRALQAMLAQETAEVFVPCLTIDHPSFTAPLRLAYDTQPLARAAGTFQPYPFTIRLPNQKEDEIPQVKVTVDNTDLQVNDAIRTLTGLPSVTLEVVLASQPDTVEAGPFDFSLQNVQADASSIQGTLGYEDDVFAQQVPGQQYLPANSPGLFL